MKLTEKISVAAVITVLGKVIVAGMSIKLGDFSFTFGGIDGTTIAAILTPCLGGVHLESWVKGKTE